jgi:hypothetical protein
LFKILPVSIEENYNLKANFVKMKARKSSEKKFLSEMRQLYSRFQLWDTGRGEAKR